jgi:Mg2+/Co2+ transporter CorC
MSAGMGQKKAAAKKGFRVGLLSHVSGKVTAPGDKMDLDGFRFEMLEANRRKVLRLRARHLPATAQTARR